MSKLINLLLEYDNTQSWQHTFVVLLFSHILTVVPELKNVTRQYGMAFKQEQLTLELAEIILSRELLYNPCEEKVKAAIQSIQKIINVIQSKLDETNKPLKKSQQYSKRQAFRVLNHFNERLARIQKRREVITHILSEEKNKFNGEARFLSACCDYFRYQLDDWVNACLLSTRILLKSQNKQLYTHLKYSAMLFPEAHRHDAIKNYIIFQNYISELEQGHSSEIPFSLIAFADKLLNNFHLLRFYFFLLVKYIDFRDKDNNYKKFNNLRKQIILLAKNKFEQAGFVDEELLSLDREPIILPLNYEILISSYQENHDLAFKQNLNLLIDSILLFQTNKVHQFDLLDHLVSCIITERPEKYSSLKIAHEKFKKTINEIKLIPNSRESIATEFIELLAYEFSDYSDKEEAIIEAYCINKLLRYIEKAVNDKKSLCYSADVFYHSIFFEDLYSALADFTFHLTNQTIEKENLSSLPPDIDQLDQNLNANYSENSIIITEQQPNPEVQLESASNPTTSSLAYLPPLTDLNVIDQVMNEICSIPPEVFKERMLFNTAIQVIYFLNQELKYFNRSLKLIGTLSIELIQIFLHYNEHYNHAYYPITHNNELNLLISFDSDSSLNEISFLKSHYFNIENKTEDYILATRYLGNYIINITIVTTLGYNYQKEHLTIPIDQCYLTFSEDMQNSINLGQYPVKLYYDDCQYQVFFKNTDNEFLIKKPRKDDELIQLFRQIISYFILFSKVAFDSMNQQSTHNEFIPIGAFNQELVTLLKNDMGKFYLFLANLLCCNETFLNNNASHIPYHKLLIRLLYSEVLLKFLDPSDNNLEMILENCVDHHFEKIVILNNFLQDNDLIINQFQLNNDYANKNLSLLIEFIDKEICDLINQKEHYYVDENPDLKTETINHTKSDASLTDEEIDEHVSFYSGTSSEESNNNMFNYTDFKNQKGLVSGECQPSEYGENHTSSTHCLESSEIESFYEETKSYSHYSYNNNSESTLTGTGSDSKRHESHQMIASSSHLGNEAQCYLEEIKSSSSSDNRDAELDSKILEKYFSNIDQPSKAEDIQYKQNINFFISIMRFIANKLELPKQKLEKCFDQLKRRVFYYDPKEFFFFLFSFFHNENLFQSYLKLNLELNTEFCNFISIEELNDYFIQYIKQELSGEISLEASTLVMPTSNNQDNALTVSLHNILKHLGKVFILIPVILERNEYQVHIKNNSLDSSNCIKIICSALSDIEIQTLSSVLLILIKIIKNIGEDKTIHPSVVNDLVTPLDQLKTACEHWCEIIKIDPIELMKNLFALPHSIHGRLLSTIFNKILMKFLTTNPDVITERRYIKLLTDLSSQHILRVDEIIQLKLSNYFVRQIQRGHQLSIPFIIKLISCCENIQNNYSTIQNPRFFFLLYLFSNKINFDFQSVIAGMISYDLKIEEISEIQFWNFTSKVIPCGETEIEQLIDQHRLNLNIELMRSIYRDKVSQSMLVQRPNALTLYNEALSHHMNGELPSAIIKLLEAKEFLANKNIGLIYNFNLLLIKCYIAINNLTDALTCIKDGLKYNNWPSKELGECLSTCFTNEMQRHPVSKHSTFLNNIALHAKSESDNNHWLTAYYHFNFITRYAIPNAFKVICYTGQARLLFQLEVYDEAIKFLDRALAITSDKKQRNTLEELKLNFINQCDSPRLTR